MVVNGGDIEGVSLGFHIMYFLTFGFKLIFSTVPSAGLGGGWPCFFVSLAMIRGLIIIVGDLATIFGCIINIEGEHPLHNIIIVTKES